MHLSCGCCCCWDAGAARCTELHHLWYLDVLSEIITGHQHAARAAKSSMGGPNRKPQPMMMLLISRSFETATCAKLWWGAFASYNLLLLVRLLRVHDEHSMSKPRHCQRSDKDVVIILYFNNNMWNWACTLRWNLIRISKPLLCLFTKLSTHGHRPIFYRVATPPFRSMV